MKKKTNCGISSNGDLRPSGSAGSDANPISRRQFGRLVVGTGAAALFSSVPSTSGVLKAADTTKGDPPPALAPKPPHLYHRMVSPAIDDLQKPWCFLSHTTTVIGMPWMPEAVQVTYDGAIFTRHAELCFFYGDSLQPVLQRQKHWLEGWIPIVQYSWQDADIAYEVEMFGAVLDGFNEENTLQFVRVRMRNMGGKISPAVFVAASRTSGLEWRFGKAQFDPAWTYEMSNGSLYREGAFLYSFPTEGAELEAVAGQPYERRFTGKEHSVEENTAVGLARYTRRLASGEVVDLIFKMPRVPTSDSRYIQAAHTAEYRTYRERTVQYWQKLLGESTRITVTGEREIGEVHRATAAQVILATRTTNGQHVQTDGLPYPMNFLASSPDYSRLYDSFRLPDAYVRAEVHFCRKDQQSNGMFLDVNLIHGKDVLSSHGQTMMFLLSHAIMSRDVDYARGIWPMIRRAVDFIRHDHNHEPHGLMRPSIAYDAEMIKGQYTSHNLWSLNALRAAIRVARLISESVDAESWLKLHDSYQSSVLKALDASAAPDGYVPTGLYKFLTGEAARKGFGQWQTDQDFENMLLAWPGEALTPSDRRVSGTVDCLRSTRYREGLMTYRNCMHLHHYITMNATMQDVVAGRDQEALLDLYHVLLHCGSTFEGFETVVFPWTDRDTHPNIPPPHAWCAAKLNGLLRNLLVVELGGHYGLDEGRRDLRLFSVVSPAWAKAGERIAVANAPTEFGVVSTSMEFRTDGADVSFKARFHDQPRDLVIHIPYFVELVEFNGDAKRAARDGADIRVSPDMTKMRLHWRIRPAVFRRTMQDLLLMYRREHSFWPGKRSQEPAAPKGFLTPEEQALAPVPLSFEAVRNAWRREYARRFAIFMRKGGKPITMKAPALEVGQVFRSEA